MRLLATSAAHRREAVHRLTRIPRQIWLGPKIISRYINDKRILALPFPPFLDYWRVCGFTYQHTGRLPDLANPRSFNDLIQWMKLFYRRPEMVTLSDKFRVRGLIQDKLGPHLLVPVITVLDNPKELGSLRFDAPFVAKATHDSGSTQIVRQAEGWSRPDAVRHFERALASNFGRRSGEWPYTKVRRRIIVERLLTSSEGDGVEASIPDDYKFHCVDGEVRFLQFITGRFTKPEEAIVSRDGQWLPHHLDENFGHLPESEWVAPPQFELLRSVAEQLSVGWRYMRVDLYLVQDSVKFGEITFFPYSGVYRGNGQVELGRFLA